MTDLAKWAEEQRALVSGISDLDLASEILEDAIPAVSLAEQEFAYTDKDYEEFRRIHGLLREAAFRLANVKQYTVKIEDGTIFKNCTFTGGAAKSNEPS